MFFLLSILTLAAPVNAASSADLSRAALAGEARAQYTIVQQQRTAETMRATFGKFIEDVQVWQSTNEQICPNVVTQIDEHLTELITAHAAGQVT